MKLFRYRRPSWKTVTGLTRVTRAARKASGISTFERYTKPSRIKQRARQKLGLYSPLMTILRQTAKGNFPTFLGLFGKKRRG